MRYWCKTNSVNYLEKLRLRFHQKTIAGKNGCLLWTGSTIGYYGQIKVRNKNTLAHRVAFMLAGNKFTDDQDVLHKCDVCLCVNNEHLFLGNHEINMFDKAKKGRAPRKLSIDQVRAIKKMLLKGKSCNSISIQYKVTPNTILDIKHGVTWRYLTI